MPEGISNQQSQVLKKLRDSGAIDFDKMGAVVTEVTPHLFDPGVVADDYIATGYSSVIKVWQTGMTTKTLGDDVQLQDMARQANDLATNVQRIAAQGRTR